MANALKLVIAATALPAFVTAFPACANAEAISAPAIAKSEAIIGAPSALSAILADQGALPRPAVAIRPASYGFRSGGYQVEDSPIHKSEFRATARIALSPAIFSGKPDIFGTVALKVDRTPLDDKWRKVKHARVGGAAAAYAASLRNREETARVEAINRFVNSRIRFAADDRQYGRDDVWSTANGTLNRGRGDCEDYAIAKIEMLRAAGFSNRDLYLVVLKDLVRQADHAVAVVRSGEHMYVLDNGTDRLLDTEAVEDYRPVLTFSAAGAWTHGYRVSRPLVVASSSTARIAPLVPARGGQINVRGALRSSPSTPASTSKSKRFSDR